MEELYTVYQASVTLKVHPITLRRYIREGKLKAIRVAGNIRIALPDLKAFTQNFVPRIKSPKDQPASSHGNFSFSDPLFRLKARGLGISREDQKG